MVCLRVMIFVVRLTLRALQKEKKVNSQLFSQCMAILRSWLQLREQSKQLYCYGLDGKRTCASGLALSLFLQNLLLELA